MKRFFGCILILAIGTQLSLAQDAPSAATQPTDTEASASPAPSKGQQRAADRLDLDTTVVTGNRELPKVLYIVPWKKSHLGDLPGQPFNTLLDEALAPVDRDVFRREVTYYDAVSHGGATRDANAPATAPAGKTQ